MEPKRILITGAAGFIGFHLYQALRKRGDFCVGIDNFNSYYDITLKEKRAEMLGGVIRLDIREQKKIEELLAKWEITHVVHLAAQAGVRHSLKAPYEYVDANMQGFVSMLEACKARKFIYASSSSVYGLNTKIPFSESDPTDHPTNLYGASKKANELIAHAYHNLYGTAVTGLRFFTVYGPWGRPDMAYYQFSRKILEGKPIEIFNHGQMERDFTYIDDIVNGIIAAVDLGSACEIFNLGNHEPVKLLYFIELLEKALGKKAIKQMLPMQPGEVLKTFADIEKSQKYLGFMPKVGIEEGILRFAKWFEEYEMPQVASR
jgi:UDP-glucuronate 4-epimerase